MINYRSFLECFLNEHDQHRIVAISNNEIVEYRRMRREVNSLYEYLLSCNRKRVIIKFNDTYSYIVSFLACIFAKKNIVILDNTVNEVFFKRYTEMNEILLTDDLSYNKYPLINKVDLQKLFVSNLKYVDDNLSQENIDLTKINCHALSCQEHVDGIEYIRTVDSIERELNSAIQRFHELQEPNFYATTLDANHVFSVLYCSFLSILSKGGVLSGPVKTQNAMTNLSSFRFVAITTGEFLLSIRDEEKVMPRASLVISIGRPVDQITNMLASQMFNCPIIHLLGSLKSAIFAYKEPLKRNFYRVLPGIEYEVAPNSTLVISKNFVTDEPLYSPLIVNSADNGFYLLGRQDRVFKYKQKSILLDDIERLVDNTGFVEHSIALSVNDGGTDYIGLAIILSKQSKKFISTKSVDEFFAILREELSRDIDEEFLPKKIRIIDKINCRSDGTIDYAEIFFKFAN